MRAYPCSHGHGHGIGDETPAGAPGTEASSMCTPGPVRALGQAMAIAFAVLSFSEALAEPIESLEAGRHSDPVRLAAIDPKTPNSGEPGSASAEPFGLIALHAPEVELWRKWRGVQHEIR